MTDAAPGTRPWARRAREPWNRYRHVWGVEDGPRECLVVEPLGDRLVRVAFQSAMAELPVGTLLSHPMPWWRATYPVTRAGRTRLGVRDFRVVSVIQPRIEKAPEALVA